MSTSLFHIALSLQKYLSEPFIFTVGMPCRTILLRFATQTGLLRRRVWPDAWGLSWVSINIRTQHFDPCSLQRTMRERSLSGWSTLVEAIGPRRTCNLCWAHKPHVN